MAKKAKKTGKKSPFGRPTRYRKAFCKKLVDYFDIEPFERVEIPHYQNDGKTIKWTDFKLIPARMPTLRKFAKSIKVPISTIYDWLRETHASYHQEFSDAFMCARQIRQDWLIDLGLSGLTPPASFKFVAVNVTDMVDKTDVTSGGVPLKSEIRINISSNGEKIDGDLQPNVD